MHSSFQVSRRMLLMVVVMLASYLWLVPLVGHAQIDDAQSSVPGIDDSLTEPTVPSATLPSETPSATKTINGSGGNVIPRSIPKVNPPSQSLTPVPVPTLDCHLNYAGENCDDAIAFLGAVIRIILGLGATIFAFMFLWGGILYMTGGAAFTEGKGKDEHTINLARKTMVNAVIGLIVILSAYAVIRFLLTELFGLK